MFVGKKIIFPETLRNNWKSLLIQLTGKEYKNVDTKLSVSNTWLTIDIDKASWKIQSFSSEINIFMTSFWDWKRKYDE